MTKNDHNETVFHDKIKEGQGIGILSFSAENKRIIYHCSRDYSTSFKNPEELVRAAYFVELVTHYDYPPERIDFEVTVPRRTPEDHADIVIFEDDELKKPFVVVECKKDGISDAEYKQAIEQAFGNANSLRSKYASVIAGITETAFDVAGFKPGEREKNVISAIPTRYGKTPMYRFIKGDKNNDLRPVSKEDLIKALEKAHDTVWQGGKLAPTTAFDEVSKLLFCKLQDEKDSTITKKGDAYKFQIGTHESTTKIFDRVNGIYQKAKQKDAEVFKEDIKLEPHVVYSVIEHLQSISFNKTDLDSKGIAFERFMEDFFKGKMGQFFTPREIIRFCVSMLDPKPNDLVLDTSSGSGGFLLNTMDYIRQYAEKESDDPVEIYSIWHDFAKDNIYGIEINDQIARICKMNMIIHDDGHSNIISTDALSNIKDVNSIHKGFKKNHFDMILTNPPFGATVKQTEKPYLQNYYFGKGKQTQKTEILFIERCLEFLKPGTGTMAIVLPDGILTNSSLQYVRDFIMENAQILAVVALPQFAFSHFGAGVKSSLLFLRKKRSGENLGNDPIFMAIAEHIGYDSTGRKDPINDLDKIYEEYQEFIKDPHNYKGC